MKTITLRNFPHDLARALEEQAAESGTSLNKTVIRLLERTLGLSPKPPGERYRDLDELAGSWTAEDAREFDRALDEQRQIDPELWG
jgi:plasmid stability protein